MKRLIILFFIIALSSACSVKREVAEVWNYVQEQPDSALSVLNSLNASSYAGPTLANYQLLKAMALDKNYIDVASDSLAKPAYEFFHRHGPKEKEMMSLYYLGMSHFYAKDYNNAVVFLDSVSDLAEQCDNPRYSALSKIYLSHIFHSRYNYAEAASAAKESIPFFSSLPDSSYQVRWARLHLADCYVGNRQFSDANGIYSSLVDHFPSDSALLRQVLPHFAWSLFLSGEEKASEALNVYQRAIKDPKFNCKRGCLGKAAVRRKDVLTAIQYLEGFGEYPELKHDLEFRLLKKRGDYKAALDECESLDECQNEVAREMLRSSLYKSQRDFQHIALENSNLQLKVEKERTYILKAIFLVILFITVSLALYWWHRTRKEKEQLVSSIEDMTYTLAQVQKHNTNLEDELDVVRQKYVAAYKKKFQKVASLVEYYRTTSGRSDGRDLVYKQVMELSSTVGKDRESMRALERNVNAALDNAMSKYREAFSGKSREHYDLVCYFMAGFPASLIELLTGIPKSTLYSKKSRLLDELAASHSPYKDLLYRSIK